MFVVLQYCVDNEGPMNSQTASAVTWSMTAFARVVSSPSLKIKDLEREAIIEALRRNDGHRRKSADELGMSIRNLGLKIKLYGIPRKYSGGKWGATGPVDHPLATLPDNPTDLHRWAATEKWETVESEWVAALTYAYVSGEYSAQIVSGVLATIRDRYRAVEAEWVASCGVGD